MLYLNPELFILKSSFATIHCESNWKWRKMDKPMPNYDLFYVWSGEGELILNGKSYLPEKGHCFSFKPGDVTAATQTYIFSADNLKNTQEKTHLNYDRVTK